MSELIKVLRDIVSLIVALFSLVAMIGIIFGLSQSQQWRALALLFYIIFLVSILWFAIGEKEYKLIWRYLTVGFLFVITIPFFIWVGTWINLQGNSLPIAEIENDDILSIESLPSYVIAYGGEDNLDDTSEGTAILTIIYGEDMGTGYIVDYYLPDASDGYAGLAYKFLEPQDFSDYKFVEIKIDFGDERAGCDFYMKDISNKSDSVRLSNTIQSNTEMNVDIFGTTQLVTIPLSSSFDNINLSVIHDIGCNTYTSISTGNHTFIISGIKFLKK